MMKYTPQNARTENYVTFISGDIPVLLTASHGGSEKPEDIESPRVESKGYKARDTETFSIQSDENTFELVFRLADKLKEKIGHQPYVVAANFHRKYVDANRNVKLLGPAEIPHENHAYDDPGGKKYYDQYHGQIRRYVADIKHQFKGEGLLFDIHGTIFQQNKIVVGMVTYDPVDFQRYFRRGHVSVDTLIARFGFDPLYHPYCGFLGALHKKKLPGGINTEVFPIDRFQKASPAGGFTVTTYGSNRPKGINAFNLDCSLKLRTEWLDDTVEIYAEAIQTLYRNVIEAPYLTETVFAGKVGLGNREEKMAQAAFHFTLNYAPKKGYPAVIMVHTRRLNTSQNSVIVALNDHPLGFLQPGKWVSIFQLDNKGWAKLRKKQNKLIASLEKQEETIDFDILKIDIVYCGS